MIARKHVITTAVMIIALTIASQARADLFLDLNGTPTTPATDDPTNTAITFGGHTVGVFSITSVSALGVNSFGGSGDLLDVSSLLVSASGAGTLQIQVTETGLTLGGLGATFTSDFTGSLTGGATATRSFYIDTSNTGAEASLLGTTTLANATFTLPEILDGAFSLTEDIVLSAANTGSKLSGDDDVFVPEPASMALLGAGLIGFGLFRRQTRKQRS